MAFAGYLKQSTAVDILLGPFIDDGDGKSAETGLTIDVELSKNGQALADSESAAPSHDAAGDVDGYYNCILGTTDTNTLGILTVVAHAAGFLPVRLDYQIVTANWFDTMCSTDQLDVNTTKIEGSDPTDTIRDSVLDDATRFSGAKIDAGISSRAPSGEYNTEMARITAERAQVLDDWINDGRLDVLLDAIPTVTQIQTEIEENGASVIDTIRDYIEHVTYGLSALKTLIDAIPTVTPDAAGTAPTSAEIKTVIEAAGSHLTLIKAVTDNLPNAGALTTIGTDTARLTAARAGVLTDWINAGRLDAILDLILADTNELQTDDIPTTLTTLSTHNAAAVKTAIEAGGSSLALIKVVTDALTAAAAAKLALSAGSIITGTVSHDNTAASTTVFYSDDITEATADHYNGRIIFFTSGALVGQAKDITDYELDTGEGKFTVTALTEAPADNVTFIIV